VRAVYSYILGENAHEIFQGFFYIRMLVIEVSAFQLFGFFLPGAEQLTNNKQIYLLNVAKIQNLWPADLILRGEKSFQNIFSIRISIEGYRFQTYLFIHARYSIDACNGLKDINLM